MIFPFHNLIFFPTDLINFRPLSGLGAQGGLGLGWADQDRTSRNENPTVVEAAKPRRPQQGVGRIRNFIYPCLDLEELEGVPRSAKDGGVAHHPLAVQQDLTGNKNILKKIVRGKF